MYAFKTRTLKGGERRGLVRCREPQGSFSAQLAPTLFPSQSSYIESKAISDWVLVRGDLPEYFSKVGIGITGMS
ncbi:hypothetical protein GCM10023190_26260 [Enteractinococcus fodinae]|uniref:Uncharacterized protein n=1 Tax=Enteractinococcus fodinae TaxID=684663 RepID=A0ABU2B1X4_9MICC|nr:hypothetical protein [Enteractinococcus fodinae]